MDWKLQVGNFLENIATSPRYLELSDGTGRSISSYSYKPQIYSTTSDIVQLHLHDRQQIW